jgi:hypothetical protein
MKPTAAMMPLSMNDDVATILRRKAVNIMIDMIC